MSVPAPVLSESRIPTPARIRVMVVDDAVIVRSLITRWVAEAPDLEMVTAVRNGQEAVNAMERSNPDVVVLDIDMPELDGISTLPLLLEKKRDLVVIMASTLTRHNAEISLRALSLGAADYIPKPETEGGIMTTASFQRELLEKIRGLGGRHSRHASPDANVPDAAPSTQVTAANGTSKVGKARVACNGQAHAAATLRQFSNVIPRVLLIGASTGGPQALMEVLPKLQAVTENAPVLITQHMPPTFTIILAEHLARACGRPVHEAVNGEPVLTGSIYLAPGGRHMRVARRAGAAVVVLDDGPPINFCKPAVDPLFSSAAEVWGASSLALVMTGMGSDGTRGAADVVAAGGSVIAQDEATSVIWGMPGSVFEAGLVSAILPLDQIAPATVRLFQGGRP
jgi:two-component system, chemotaxis family, protein-glutamate methylesterase/glutaminase